MARQRRKEYPGAVYHVMARGNRREAIVLDDEDRIGFERTLEQLVNEFGFELIAYVLMGNYYHLLIRTPLGNLVAGMQWFQNTWTKHFNSRHKLRWPFVRRSLYGHACGRINDRTRNAFVGLLLAASTMARQQALASLQERASFFSRT